MGRIRKFKSKNRYTKRILVKGQSGHFLRKIPEKSLKDALEIIENVENYYTNWNNRNKSCIPLTDTYQESFDDAELTTSPYYKLKYMRQCLLRRDWRNLARLLSLTNVFAKHNTRLFSIYLKYGVICLAHNNIDLFQTLIKASSSTSTPDEIIAECTQIEDHIKIVKNDVKIDAESDAEKDTETDAENDAEFGAKNVTKRFKNNYQ